MKPFIPKKEFHERIAMTQQAMKEEGLDVLFCFGNEAEPQYIRYYSNYAPLFESAGILIPAEGDPILIIGPESETLALEFSEIKDIRKILYFRESSEPEYPEAKLDTFEGVISDLLDNQSSNKLGIVGSSLITNVIFEELKAAINKIGAVEVLKSDSLVSKIKMKKSRNELACMQEAYSILQYAFEQVLKSTKIGMTENEVKGIALKAIYEKGGESEGYPFWILTGKGSNKPVGKSKNKEIKDGDIIQIQMGARYEGYVASLGRALVAGEPTTYEKDLINAGFEVQKAILEKVKPGVNAKEISKIHFDTLDRLGFADHILYGPCHGTGLMENEHPWMESNSDYILEPGMTFCTCLYLGNDEKEIGIRIEDGFYISEDKAHLFTDHNRKIIKI